MSSYNHRHWLLRRDRGSASQHTCFFCGGQARDWAQVHGTDGENPWTDYVSLCRACHIRYDGSGHHQPHTKQARQKMSESQRLAYAEGRRTRQNNRNAGMTQCPAGHDYTEDNTYIAPDGSRVCKKCRRENARRWRQGREGGDE